MRERRYPRTPIDTENPVFWPRFIVTGVDWDWHGLEGYWFGDRRTPVLLGATLHLVTTGSFNAENVAELLGRTVIVKEAGRG